MAGNGRLEGAMGRFSLERIPGGGRKRAGDRGVAEEYAHGTTAGRGGFCPKIGTGDKEASVSEKRWAAGKLRQG